MGWKYTDEYYKEYTRTTWNESAAKYLPVLQQLRQYHPDLLGMARPAAGEKVLDVATGPGEPAMTIAEAVGPKGSVTGIDLSETMVGIARTGAAERRLRNVAFKIMDAEKMQFSKGTFDLAISTFGFQIITDPEKAAREMFRVLRPGGRIALAVWGTGETAPALHVMVGPMLEHAEPDETGYLPTPYELGAAGQLAELLRGVGCIEVEERRVVHDWTMPSVDAYLDMLFTGTPLGHSLSEEEAPIREEVLAKTRTNIARYATAAGVSIPAECVLVLGRKPAAKARTRPAPRGRTGRSAAPRARPAVRRRGPATKSRPAARRQPTKGRGRGRPRGRGR